MLKTLLSSNEIFFKQNKTNQNKNYLQKSFLWGMENKIISIDKQKIKDKIKDKILFLIFCIKISRNVFCDCKRDVTLKNKGKCREK